MAFDLATLFPGVDLCTIPSRPPPSGQVSNFEDPTASLRDVIICLTVVPTVFALVFAAGRLWANIARRSWSDGMVFIATLVAVTQTVLLITFVRYYRHMWDVPFCWLSSQFFRLSFTYTVLYSLGLLLAKTSTLLLYHEVFQISRNMRLAIRFGIVINVVFYAISPAVLSYYMAPHVGETWDDLAVHSLTDPYIFPVRWGVAAAVTGAAIDLYIFVLPIPTIIRLNLSTRKRIQIMTVFFTAILGICASLVSIGYRVKSLANIDGTWIAGIIMICNQIELSAAIVVCSMPGFASFIRTNISDSKLASSLGSVLKIITRGASQGTTQKSASFDPNQPRSGHDRRGTGHKPGKYGYCETWLMESRSKIDIEHQGHPLQHANNGGGMKVENSLDSEQLSWVPSENSGRGLVFH